MDKIRTEGPGEDEDMRRKSSSFRECSIKCQEGRENTQLPFYWLTLVYLYTRVMSSKIFNIAGNLAFLTLEKSLSPGGNKTVVAK